MNRGGETRLLDRMRAQLTAPGSTPVYARLQEAVQDAVTSGDLRPGDPLPTVRAVAAELNLAPNTVAKAYTALQRHGLTENRAGAGTTVAAGAWAGRLGHADALRSFRVLVAELRAAGVSLEALREVLDDLDGE